MRTLSRFSPVLAGLSVLFFATTSHAQSVADLVPDALDPQACGGQGCWTNHLRVTDLDGDGDLDILLVNYADFFGGGDDAEPLVIYENDGNAGFTNVSATALGNHAGTHRMAAVGDVDGDGDVDIYAPSGNGGQHFLFINGGNGAFTDEAEQRMPTDTPPASAATRMGDVDGDGDLDIFAADGYAQGSGVVGRLYVNNGQGAFEEAVGAIPNSIDGQDIDDVEFADVDRDFDLDLLVNAHSGGAGALWLNDGQGTFAAGGTLAPPGPGSQFHYNVTPCDVDGDGDLDLWVDNVGGNYTEQLQINDGDGNFTDETSSRVTGNAAGSDDNGVICADIDDDGDFDAVVIALGSPERLLQNDGAGSFTFVANAFPGPTNCSLWGEMGDLNGDDRLDLVTGQGECSSSDEVYLGNDQMPVDAKPPVIVAVRPMPSVEQGSVAAAQFAVSDRTVTDEGPRLARAYAVLDPAGAATEIPATFMGGDLFRAEVPAAALGTFTFRACAVDPAGNETCSTDQSYTVVEDTGEGGGGAGMGGASNAGGNGNGGANGPGGGSANGGGGGAIDDGGGSGDGCDCGLAKQTTRSPWAILSLIGTAIALRARRRRR